MDITALAIIVAAVCGIVWVYPRLPQIGQIVLAIIIAVACLLIVLRYAGVPISL
jgi:hypothetical protein